MLISRHRRNYHQNKQDGNSSLLNMILYRYIGFGRQNQVADALSRKTIETYVAALTQ